MSRPLARFAVVGSLVTAVDVGTFVLLRRRGRLRADVAALAMSAAASHALHRAVTFREDPYDRWLGQRGSWARAAVAGGAIDVAVVAAAGPAVPTKLAAVAAAAPVRWILHRRTLFAIVRAGRHPLPGRAMPEGRRRLSVVLPAYGEADRIGQAVKAVRAALPALDGDLEVVVVDDGSVDGTGEAAHAAGADLVLRLEHNHGKGAAVRAGVLAASGRTVAFTDADLAYDPEQLERLVAEVEAGWDMVVGSRKHDDTRTLVRAGRLREVGGRVINWLTHLVVLGNYRDTQCGLKAFRADVARPLFAAARIDGFAFDVELFVIAERNGLHVTEVPVTVANTTRSTVRVARDAQRLVRDLFKIRRWAREGAYRLPPP